jgi:3-hydroxybutyryl-CoA dehydrogenase
MTALERSSTIAVVGTGTMGQGIAQVALAAGHHVRLYDAAPGRAEQAERETNQRFDRLVEKGRLDSAERDAARARLAPAVRLEELADASLVIEAILEDLGAKQQLFSALETVVRDDCLLATNTSSLSVTAVAGALRLPGRFLGLHFFNPAPLMPLVEVVSGHATDEAAATAAYETAAAWGRTPVRCTDTPGFIVNRIARPFYAEAFRLYEEGAADPATIDAVLRECGGFRMGPFELTDLIGHDVNEAVTRSVWESFFHDPKFTPSLAQRRLVESGRLGRKSGRGWYDHAQGAQRPEPRTAAPEDAPGEVTVSVGEGSPAAALLELITEAGIKVHEGDSAGEYETHIELPGGGLLYLADGAVSTQGDDSDTVQFDLAFDYRSATRLALAPADSARPETVRAATGLFQALGKQVSVVDDVPGLIVARTVAMLVDFAADALARGVASAADIDTAMRLGVNYPRGPLEWGDVLGPGWVYCLLQELRENYPGGRYASSGLLYRRWVTKRKLL